MIKNKRKLTFSFILPLPALKSRPLPEGMDSNYRKDNGNYFYNYTAQEIEHESTPPFRYTYEDFTCQLVNDIPHQKRKRVSLSVPFLRIFYTQPRSMKNRVFTGLLLLTVIFQSQQSWLPEQ